MKYARKALYRNYAYGEGCNPPSDSVRRGIVLSLVGEKRVVLDVGCLDGSISVRLASRGNHVLGMDLCCGALKHAKEKGIQVIVADAETSFPVRDGTFDVVFAGELIEHVLDIDWFLQEIRRVLRPGGFLVLSTPNLASLGRRFLLIFGRNPFIDISPRRGAGHVRYFVKDTLFEILMLHGFKIVYFTSDVVNLNRTGSIYSTSIVKIFPTLGRSLIVKAFI